MKFRQVDLEALAGFLGLSLMVAGVSAAATIANVAGWYAGLNKPPFNPPNWIFGPVWTLLYAAMAVAAWRVWRTRRRASVAIPLSLYAIQMALNFVWSLLFFGAHRIGLAMIDIASLLVVLAITMLAFWRHEAVAGFLMAPYLAWVTFAAILNYSIWRLN